jgi:hypothetical protein
MNTKALPLGRIMLKNVRLAFPQLFTPKAFQGDGDPRYSCRLLIRNDDPQLAHIREVMKQVAKEKWPTKNGKIEFLISQNKVCLQDGAAVADEYDGFENHHALRCSSPGNQLPPTVLDADKTLLTESSGKPYAGCYVNASVEIWAQSNAYGERINCRLRGIQFFRDGDAFGGGRPANPDEFDSTAEDAPASDFV